MRWLVFQLRTTMADELDFSLLQFLPCSVVHCRPVVFTSQCTLPHVLSLALELVCSDTLPETVKLLNISVILGALITLTPLYLAEVAAAEIRGRVVGTTGIMIGVGYASANWIGFAFYFVNESGAQWRVPTAIQCIPPLLLALGIWWLPESPRWRESYPFLTQ